MLMCHKNVSLGNLMAYERYTPYTSKSRVGFDHDFKIDDINFEINSYNFFKKINFLLFLIKVLKYKKI